MQNISSLKTSFDEIEKTNGEDECRAWLTRIYDAEDELAEFVATRRGIGRAAQYVDSLLGSFNFSLRFKFSDRGPDAIIRFPRPGQTATFLRDEKVANEVHVIDYIRQNTTIPLPRVYSWGFTAESPQQFGPFIIMDYVEGTLLSTVLQQPTERDQEDLVLNPSIDNSKLDTIYRQIADYLLQLSRLTFTHIGAISQTAIRGYPASLFPTSTFDRVGDYLEALSDEHLAHLFTQRNLADDPEIAQARFIARHGFTRLIDEYCIDDTGPFIPFCDDLQPSNMLVDPETLQIKAVIDLEFTNAMPAQFTYDPPWWLLLSGPEAWLDRDSMDEFRDLYEPRMEQFLQALELVEGISGGQNLPGPPLSTRMRDSWRSGRFWFNYAARKGFAVDAIYWAALHDGDGGDGIELLSDEAREQMEPFIEHKMQQLVVYEEDHTALFTDEPNFRF